MPGTGSKCPECGMIFRVPSNLAKHRRRIHRDFAARQESSNTCASCFACIVRLFRNCFSLSTRKRDDRDYNPPGKTKLNCKPPGRIAARLLSPNNGGAAVQLAPAEASELAKAARLAEVQWQEEAAFDEEIRKLQSKKVRAQGLDKELHQLRGVP